MRILVIGSGGREHALVWKLRQSKQVNKIFCAPGNGGISAMAESVQIKPNQHDDLLAFARDNQIDLTIVGPEDPLAGGIVDKFEQAGQKIFGPSKAAAEIESSKVFAKQFMTKYHIPTAPYKVFDNLDEASQFVGEVNLPVVIKADGLAAGKGAIIVNTVDEARDTLQKIMVDKAFGEAGNQVVIEDKLIGEELTLMAFTDGKSVLPLLPSQDHKPVFDEDEGPNTGGMGAFCPVPFASDKLVEMITDLVLEPAIRGLWEENRPFRGILYAGLMITDFGPRVIEFNCRFGDPETQAVLPLISHDLAALCMAVANHNLELDELNFFDRFSVGVVMASGGYPGSYDKGKLINGIDRAISGNRQVFHAGSTFDKGKYHTSGGRVLCVVAQEDNLQDAIASAYDGVNLIEFDNAHFRKDIAARASRRRFRFSRQV
jgi:phosphoribosylamine--glycine ligase